MSVGTYALIDSTTVTGSAAASVTFNSIPGTYTDLVIVAMARRGTDGAGGAGTIQFNSDTGSNYSSTILYGDAGSALSFRWSNQTALNGAFNAGDSELAVSQIHFLDYANTTTYKTVISRYGWSVTNGRVVAGVNLWRSTAAITSITLSAANNITVGSTFKLYGIEARNQ